MTETGASPLVTVSEGFALRRNRRLLALIVLVLLAGCAAATWWQVRRALDGNLFSYFYSFLWPGYGCYVAGVWWRLRRGPHDAAPGAREPAHPDVPEAGEDTELTEYNRYLAAQREHVQHRRR